MLTRASRSRPGTGQASGALGTALPLASRRCLDPRLPAGAAALLLAVPAGRAAEPYPPPGGKIWNGLTAGFDAGDFQRRAGKHPAIWQHFIALSTTTSTR